MNTHALPSWSPAFTKVVTAAILEATTAARRAVLERVHACPRCGEWFLKHRKQKFCTSRCMEREKLARYRAKRRGGRPLMDVLANGTDEVAFLADVPHEQQTHAWDVEV